MNKFLSANKSKIVWIVVSAIAILLVTLLAINLFWLYPPPLYMSVNDKPPSAVLQIQGSEQKGHGKYFFGGVNWANSDDFTASTPRKALVTASPFSATLKFAADKPPNVLIFMTSVPQAVSIKVADTAALGKPRRVLYGSEPSFSWNVRDVANNAILTKDLDLKNEQTFTLELKRGLYVINITAKWSEDRFAVYAFLIDVK